MGRRIESRVKVEGWKKVRDSKEDSKKKKNVEGREKDKWNRNERRKGQQVRKEGRRKRIDRSNRRGNGKGKEKGGRRER